MACFFLSLVVIIIIIVLNTCFPTLCSSNPIFISNLTTDQHALLAFKDSISGRVLTQNWSTNSSVCYWIGVSCGPKHQRVTALNVSGLGLKGTIAPHLGNLTFLQSLDISNNNFTGSIPSELTKLRRLKAINLESNQITGPIPNGMFNNISSLEEINMRNNGLSGGLPNDMCKGNSPKLKILYLTGNRLEGEIPASIQKCREIEDLRLGENHFNGNIPSEIWSLPNLTLLSLRKNQLQGFSAHVGNVAPRIEEVYISENHLTGGIPSFIFNISSLRVLDLSSNSLSGSIPAHTPYNLPVVQVLYLSSSRTMKVLDTTSSSLGSIFVVRDILCTVAHFPTHHTELPDESALLLFTIISTICLVAGLIGLLAIFRLAFGGFWGTRILWAPPERLLEAGKRGRRR